MSRKENGESGKQQRHQRIADDDDDDDDAHDHEKNDETEKEERNHILPPPPERELRRPYEVQTPTKYRKPLPTTKNNSNANGSTSSHSTAVSNSNTHTTNQADGGISSNHSTKSSTTSKITTTSTTTNTSAAIAVSRSVSQPEVPLQQQQQHPTVITSETTAVSTVNTAKEAQTPPIPNVSTATTKLQNHSPQQQQVRTTTSPSKKQSPQAHRDFQRTTDIPSVQIRYVNVTQRSAFLHYSLSSLRHELETKWLQQPHNNRISPSWNHLQILHRIYNTHIVRQIQFSPSTSIDADYHYQMQQQLPTSSQQQQNNGGGQERSNHKTTTVPPSSKRDGRYRRIDPTNIENIFRHIDLSKYKNDSFPSPPRLSHRKYRLPNRADVGFGRCSEEEIQIKQQEIRNETMWEEVQVRMTTVVTSIDLIRMANTTTNDDEDDDSILLKYMPYAGRHLRSAVMTKKRPNSSTNHNHRGHGKISIDDVVVPNPYSMLAPPIESTYSPSQGWRPRIYHDRPVGLRYCYVSPMNVTVWSQRQQRPPIPNNHYDNNNKTMIGSLALYTLPPLSKRLINGSVSGLVGPVTAAIAATYHCQKNQSIPAFGKISEEFHFPITIPASSSVQQGPATPENAATSTNNTDTDRKAIFSYNPMDLVMESATRSSSVAGPDSLYIVLRVYEMIPIQECSNQPTPKEHCNRLLQHVAFGVTKVYSKTKMQWPDGQVKALQLYSYPPHSETQGSFVERLWRIVHQKSFVASSKDGSESSHPQHDDETLSHGISATDDSVSTSRRHFGDRMFRTTPPRYDHHSRSKSVNAIDIRSIQNHEFHTTPICGTAQLFLSSLNIDFLQCMLTSPMNTAASITSQSPLHLIDATGDFAVTTNPNVRETGDVTVESNVGKRSNLLRLPQHVDRAGYCGTNGCHEILYLPARPDRQYHLDSHMANSRSLLNFLYIYPRLIRLSSHRTKKLTMSDYQFTIRIRLVRTDGTTTDHIPSPIPCFYNHTAWDGAGLIPAIYTSIAEITGSVDTEGGLSIQDEIRLRLPEILDGKFNLVFTLFKFISVDNAVLELTALATASIPLTSTRSKDTTSRFHVATIVPNGKHRLEIGEYQLHFETRLLSSIHTSDPYVAATLRSFSMEEGQKIGDFDAPIRESFSSTTIQSSDIASQINGSAVASYFQALIYANLRGLIESSNGTSSDTVNSLSNFSHVLKVLKAFLLSKSGTNHSSFGHFVKSFLDLFDESCLFDPAPSTPTNEVQNQIIEANEPVILESHGEDDDGFEVDVIENQDLASRQEGNQRRFNWRRRKPQIQTKITSDGLPFSRVPFDASGVDRMRTETELRSWRGHLAPMYDDDETIATAPSIFSTRHSVDTQTIMSVTTMKENFNSDASAPLLHSFDENSIMRHEPMSAQHSLGDTEFVKRVRSAAAIILAPCVTPSLTSVLRSPQGVTGAIQSTLQNEDKDGEANVFVRTARCLCLPGSDVDDDVQENRRPHFSTKRRTEPNAIKSIRERLDNAKESLSIITNGFDKESKGSVRTIHEMLIKMILRTDSDVNELEKSQSARIDESSNGVVNESFDLVEDLADHMDFIVPLCLRSIILRYCGITSRPVTKLFIEKGDLALLVTFIGFLVRCLMFQGMASRADVDGRESALQRSLQSSRIVIEFIVGLTSFVHAKQVEVLLHQYFQVLRDNESKSSLAGTQTEKVSCSGEIFQRMRCSQQLRLLAVETLSALPSFLALNVPMKYAAANTSEVRIDTTTWLSQYVGSIQGTLLTHSENQSGNYVDSGWLADLAMKECLFICSTSCQCIVQESTALIEESSSLSKKTSAFRMHQESSLRNLDLVALHSTAFHAITIVYELVVRRHSMDQRFQSQSAQGRIAGLLTKTILAQSCENVRWLAKLDSTNQIRSTWLLCFLYIIQEAPEGLLYDFIRTCRIDKSAQIHEFIGLLNLCSSTFQYFLRTESIEYVASVLVHQTMPVWLFQESFNSICAAAIVVVDVCVESLSHPSTEKTKAIQDVVDLLLVIATIPQSPVTHLRAVGALLLILEGNVELFLSIVDSDLEHWTRILLSLMNCQSLSVRSIAVDFAISLFSGIFVLLGNIDSITIMFGSILPEVIGREIALHCVCGQISTMEEVATSVWPIRRAIADLGDANPLDDDRINPILATVLSNFSRACQAIVDGVLVELRLQGDNLYIVGVDVKIEPYAKIAFDADEESLFEAASFFRSDMAPIQRIRWLLTLRTFHASRLNWLEASECLFLCAKTICFALPFIKNTWRPSRFERWTNGELSAWVATVGVEIGQPARGNVEVMAFAEHFLEPTAISSIQHFTVKAMCELLVRFTTEAIEFSNNEIGFEPICHDRLQSLLEDLRDAVNEIESQPLTPKVSARMRKAEDESALRAVSTLISEKIEDMTTKENKRHPLRTTTYIAMRVHGKKPIRFEESTTIPTFLEWDRWCVSRVPSKKCGATQDAAGMKLIEEFAKPYIESLREYDANIILRTKMDDTEGTIDQDGTYLDVLPVEMYQNRDSSLNPKHFVFRSNASSTIVKEGFVANEFPCALSRQRVEIGAFT